jgi:hypothetical protein
VRQFFERASKPDWCAELENFVRATVNDCPDATLFGSWATSEETLLLLDGQYHVMSDIDVSYAGGDARMQLLQATVSEVIPRARIDHSDVFAFANESQSKQRLLAPTKVLGAAIDMEEIAEAIAIRVFYSSLDIWSSARSLDIHGIVYSLVRMIAEIPLYYCWNAGLICGSYRTQLDIAIDRTSITQLEAFDLVQRCVECKISVLVMRRDIDERDVSQLLQEYVRVFQTVVSAMSLDRTQYGAVSLRLLDLLRASLKVDSTLALDSVETAWNHYGECVPDGRVRNQYLSKRVRELRIAPAANAPSTHYPVRTTALRKLA